MKQVTNRKIQMVSIFSLIILLIASCAPEIKLTSSWTNRQAKVKSSPVIMVLALGKSNSTVRQDVENNIVDRLKKSGFKAVPGSNILQPGVVKHDSAEIVKILQQNNIDLLLTNAVVSISENTRFEAGAIQGTDIVVPAGGPAAIYGPYDGSYVGYNYYNYYNAYNSYQTIEAQAAPGTTITDLHVIIESNLYKVSSPELIWHGQSRGFTNRPSESLINAFGKNVVNDIIKNNLFIK